MDVAAPRGGQWERIKGFLPGGRKGKRDPRTDDRRSPDARDRPERFGDYRSVKRPHYSCIGMGVLDHMPAVLGREADLEWLMIDPTIVRARQPVAGARKVKRGADAQGLGRSRGGLSTRILTASESLGLPLRLIATPGQRNDIAFAHELIDGLTAEVVIADKGYDADHLAERMAGAGTEVVIPPRRNRSQPRLVTSISTRSATASSASSESSSSSAASQPATTSSSPTSWASSNSPPSPSGSGRQIVTTT